MTRQAKLVLVGSLLLIILAGLYLMPGRSALMYQLGQFTVGVLVFLRNLILAVVVIAAPFFIGLLAKTAFKQYDAKNLPKESVDALTRNVVLVLGATVTAILWILVTPYLVPISYLAPLGEGFGFSNTFETPPLWWGVWAFVIFWFGWENA